MLIFLKKNDHKKIVILDIPLLLENKINIPKPYDYQVDEIKKVKDGLVEFPNFKKKNKEKLNA